MRRKVYEIKNDILEISISLFRKMSISNLGILPLHIPNL
jgi:hypothetical protein